MPCLFVGKIIELDIGGAEEIRKGIRKCRVMEKKKKFTYGLKKSKHREK